MKHFKFSLPFILAIFILSSCTEKPSADFILTNGNIQTVDENLTVVEAMAVKDGLILATGQTDSLLSVFNAQKIIDLEGKYVYPGFIDPHSHFIGYSMNLLHANLWMSASMNEIIERLKLHQNTMMGEWLQGRGWDQNLFENKEMPDNSLLNSAFPDIPVYLVRVDGHAAVANDMALQLAGIIAESTHRWRKGCCDKTENPQAY
jgi:predicted amidohydrolase YtcJ